AEGPKCFVNIEGEDKPWDQSTITTEQIINLAAWPPNQQVIEVDADNNERTLQPGEGVTLKPGVGFAKKVKFRRGRLCQARFAASNPVEGSNLVNWAKGALQTFQEGA